MPYSPPPDPNLADHEQFYSALHDYFVAILQPPGAVQWWAVPGPDRFWPTAHCVITVRGTREHWHLHVVRRDTHEVCDVSPVVAHWWAWTHGAWPT